MTTTAATTTSDLFPSHRLDEASAAAGRAGLDALLISPGADLRYLTGYDALPLERLTCLVLPVSRDPFLVVPALEKPAALTSPVGHLDLEVLDWAETEDPYALVAERLDGVSRVGVDNHMWAERVMEFGRVLPNVDQDLAGPVLSQMRMRKSAAEVRALRDAAACIDRVHARTGEWVRPGRTEREVGRDIAGAIVDEGHARVDFVIVASGPNSASPHAGLSDRVLEPSDVVVVDIGGTTADGYCSDSTRTYALGEPAHGFRDAYAVLQRAQDAACGAVAPGVAAGHVDAAARDPITEAGYGDYFVHRTGHGIGLESHEEPYIVAGNGLALEPGMVFSVEPGIYLPGRHGARVEDIVVCTEQGVERMNRRPRDLVVL